MPNQPIRRSARLAAKAKTTDALNADKKITPRTRRASKSNAKSCSLQTLKQTPRKAQKTDKKATRKAPQKSTGKKKRASSLNPPETPRPLTTTKHSPKNRRVTLSPATKSKVTPPKGVKFNLRRNSYAEYNKENAPNVVEHLSSEVAERKFPDMFQNDEEITPLKGDDEETKRNEETLAQWEDSFDDLELPDDSTFDSDDYVGTAAANTSKRAGRRNYYSGSFGKGGHVLCEEEEILDHEAYESAKSALKSPAVIDDVHWCDRCQRGLRTLTSFVW